MSWPEKPTKVIIHIYDIFGIWPQTLQGADRLAAHTGAAVLVPDFFEGDGLPQDAIPMVADEKKKITREFFEGVANLESNLAKLVAVRKEIETRFPEAEGHVGAFGPCWGGKLAVLAGGEGNEGPGRRLNATGTAHPG
jgi:dienelactone hydrolase